MQRPTGRTILTAPSTGTQSTPAEPLYSHRSNKIEQTFDRAEALSEN
jgi:hypothetical protein